MIQQKLTNLEYSMLWLLSSMLLLLLFLGETSDSDDGVTRKAEA